MENEDLDLDRFLFSYGADGMPKESLGLALELACGWMDCVEGGVRGLPFADRMQYYRDRKLIRGWRDRIVAAEDRARDRFVVGLTKSLEDLSESLKSQPSPA